MVVSKHDLLVKTLQEEVPEARLELTFANYDAMIHKGTDSEVIIYFDREALSILTAEEALAFLYHEIGHYKTGQMNNIRNVLWGERFILGSNFFLISFYALTILFSVLSALSPPFFVPVVITVFVVTVIYTSRFSNRTMTKHEIEADNYAIANGYGTELLSAFLRLYMLKTFAGSRLRYWYYKVFETVSIGVILENNFNKCIKEEFN